MCRNPTLILEGMTPHAPHRHDDVSGAISKALARNAGNIAWLLRRHRFNIACGAVFLIGVALAVGCAGPGDAGYAPVVKSLVSSAARG